MTHEGNTREVNIFYLINICKSDKDFFTKFAKQNRHIRLYKMDIQYIQAGNDRRDSLQ